MDHLDLLPMSNTFTYPFHVFCRAKSISIEDDGAQKVGSLSTSLSIPHVKVAPRSSLSITSPMEYLLPSRVIMDSKYFASPTLQFLSLFPLTSPFWSLANLRGRRQIGANEKGQVREEKRGTDKFEEERQTGQSSWERGRQSVIGDDYDDDDELDERKLTYNDVRVILTMQPSKEPIDCRIRGHFHMQREHSEREEEIKDQLVSFWFLPSLGMVFVRVI